MDAINGTPVKRRPLQNYRAWRADNIRPYKLRAKGFICIQEFSAGTASPSG